jgi:hypothetical protein
MLDAIPWGKGNASSMAQKLDGASRCGVGVNRVHHQFAPAKAMSAGAERLDHLNHLYQFS